MKSLIRIYMMALVMTIVISLSVAATYVDERRMQIPVGEIKTLEINAGAGKLEIEGNTNTSYIEVRAEIVIDGTTRQRAERFVEEFLELSLQNLGKSARLDAYFDYNNTFSLASATLRTAEINVVVRLPKQIVLEIEDGSGDTYIVGMDADILLDDGSGELEIEDINGNLDIDDGSGGVIIRNIKGDIRLDDGSGEIYIREVTGDIEIDDGSGEIDVSRIDGSVSVNDGSGDIDISHITRDVDVFDDSSGDCMISNVDGRIKR